MDRKFTIRFVLPNGEQSVQQLCGSTTVAEMKTLLMRKKPHCFADVPNDRYFSIRLLIARSLSLSTDRTLVSILDLYHVFREDNQLGVTPDFLVLRNEELDDEVKLKTRKLSKGEPIVFEGYLRRQRANSVKFKREYMVLQSSCLFTYASESAFLKRGPSDHVFEMGSFEFQEKEEPPCTLRIRVEHLPTGKKPLVIQAETKEDFALLTQCLHRCNYRYSKCAIVSLTERLESRYGLTSEGLFRVAGGTQTIKQLLFHYECGRDVASTNLPIDEHVICSALKFTVRHLHPPLFTYKMFPEFTRLMAENDFIDSSSQKLRRFADLLAALPVIHVGLIQYLMGFLSRVTQQAVHNKMNSYNLGLIFGPNVLRAKVQTADHLRSTSSADLVSFIIDNYESVFNDSKVLDYVHSKPPIEQNSSSLNSVQDPSEPISCNREQQQRQMSLRTEGESVRCREESSSNSYSSCMEPISKSDDSLGLVSSTVISEFRSTLQQRQLLFETAMIAFGNFELDSVPSDVKTDDGATDIASDLAKCLHIDQRWREMALDNCRNIDRLLRSTNSTGSHSAVPANNLDI